LNPLWERPNVIVIQTTGGGTWDKGPRKVDTFVDNYRRFRHEQPLTEIVDWKRGY